MLLRELSAPPEAVSILVGAAPLRGAGVVIEDDHKANIGESLHSYIEYFHCRLSYELRIGSQEFFINNIVLKEEFEGIGESDAIHFELVTDIHSDVPHGPALQSVDAVTTHVTS